MNPSACYALQACWKPLAPLVLAALCPFAHAAITVPGADGSDGALNITANTEIDLSQAVTGTWDANNAANAGKGVYDPAKWAVVFKYTDVTVAAGATVTFKNHASRAPVVWLVSGNVTIDGTVSLSGQNGQPAPLLAEPGPGGFRGGVFTTSAGVTGGPGFGPGGGGFSANTPGGGSYSTQGINGSSPYGNPALIPLIGGSGGGGKNSYDSVTGGGGGGGALLIAVINACTINGEISANGGAGGAGGYWDWSAGSGSGGGVRVIAETLSGTGRCFAKGGSTDSRNDAYAGAGRIRLERLLNTGNVEVVPAPSTVDLTVGATALLWPPAGAPEVRVVSIGAAEAPADPRAAFGTYTPDVALPLASSTEVIVETVNVEQASQVKVRITPRDSANYTEVAATYSSTVSADPLTLRWTATVPTTMGNSAVQARVIRP
jgi:plastocyanin